MIKKWKALVIDEVMVTREGTAAVLERVTNIESVRVCDNFERAPKEIKENEITLVMLDLETNKNSGILFGRNLLKSKPGLNVIVYSRLGTMAFAAEIYNQECRNTSDWKPSFVLSGTFKTGEATYQTSLPFSLHGYTEIQNITPDILRKNLNIIDTSGGFLDSEITQLLFERLTIFRLTPREQQCAEWISLGKSNNEIAELLGITRQAVENLINSLYHKFSIKGEPKDSSRRVLLTLIIQRWKGLA